MWSWVLVVCGILGTYTIGRKRKWGWVILFFNETLWLVYAFTTKQYGFILGALAYMTVYVKSYRKWTKDEGHAAVMPVVEESYSGNAYCVKCKESVEFEGSIKTSDSGRQMAQGKCPRCGTKVNRILGKAS